MNNLIVWIYRKSQDIIVDYQGVYMSIMRYILLFILQGALITHAQSTMVVLPTNDDTSAFEVKQEDGTTVLGAKGDGSVTVSGTMSAQDIELTGDASISGGATIDGNADVSGSVNASTFYGDGSTLSNVRTVAAYSGGYQSLELSGSVDRVIRYVEITVPSAGTILVHVSGSAEYFTVEKACYRGSITTGTSLSTSYIISGTKLASATDDYKTEAFAAVRGFTVSSPGTYRYNFVADMYEGETTLHNVAMTAVFSPTAGVGAPKIVSVEEPSAAPISRGSGPFDKP